MKVAQVVEKKMFELFESKYVVIKKVQNYKKTLVLKKVLLKL